MLEFPDKWKEPYIYLPVIESLMTDPHKFKVVPTARRSGKSFSAKRYTVLEAMKKKGDYFLCAPTRDQARKIFWQDIGEYIPKWFMENISKTELQYRLKNGSTINVVGLDVPARIEGVAIDGIVVDEIADCKEDTWFLHIRPALMTLNLDPWVWLIGCPNGFGFYKDLYDYACSGQDKDWKGYHWVAADILPKDSITAARRELSPMQFRQEMEGSFENATGRVYSDYTNENHTDKVFNPNNKEIIFTHDQNFSPMSSAIIQTEGENIYCVDEIILASASAQDVGFEFVERYKGHEHCMVKIYGDVSGNIGAKHGKQSFYIILEQVLRNAGFRVHNNVPRSNPRIIDGQNSLRTKVLNALGERSFFVNPKTCKHIDKGMRTVSLKKGSSFLEDETNDCQHVLTALRYYTHREFAVKHTKKPTKRYWK